MLAFSTPISCRHVLVAYFPGVSKASPRRSWTTADEDRYKAQQKQRAYERRIRQLKLQLAGFAEGSPQYVEIGARIRATQAALRAHLAQHPDLNRRRQREQTDLGFREGR